MRAGLSRERVIEAAVALADTEGIDALSMRRLATALGVQAMSLYNHVKDKDDLLDALVERVVAEIELPPPGTPWRAALRHRSQAAHAALMRHPWACPLLMSRPNVGPAMLRYLDWTLGVLYAAGFPPALADHAWNVLDAHLYGFTLHKLTFPFEVGQYAAAASFFLPTLADGRYPAFRRLTVEVAEGRHDGIQRLEFGLDMLLDGLERTLADSRDTGVG
ncbi:MAG: TetR/AcrR family transcriptional regulator [Myxococcota bacterium]